jgi:hypothetical protein
MEYRILCDENAEPQVVRYLERQGHTAVYVPDILEKCVSDTEIAESVDEATAGVFST